MKKLFIILAFSIFAITNVFAADNIQLLKDDIGTIKYAISSYKAQNYLQCISTLTEYVNTHPVSAAAFYYLGNAYMKLGLGDKAKENYAKTANINTVPQLTSYAIQAIDCIDRGPGAICVYYTFNKKQIVELQANPKVYLDSVRNNLLAEEVREGSDPDIEKLIKGEGEFSGRIHPEAKKVLIDERTKRDRYNMNKRSMLPVSEKIAKVIRAEYPVHSYAPNAESSSTEVTADEMELIIMSETAALNMNK